MKPLKKIWKKFPVITMINFLPIHIAPRMKVQTAYIISKIWTNV